MLQTFTVGEVLKKKPTSKKRQPLQHIVGENKLATHRKMKSDLYLSHLENSIQNGSNINLNVRAKYLKVLQKSIRAISQDIACFVCE